MLYGDPVEAQDARQKGRKVEKGRERGKVSPTLRFHQRNINMDIAMY
jgi:hypothetical protein